MIKEDKARIIHGEVYYRNQWMPIAKKAAMVRKERKMIEQGLVHYQGEWIPIEEKLARVSPAPMQQRPQQVIINQTYNQQTYDQRTVHEHTVHEHKHLHLDADTLMAYGKAKGLGTPRAAGAIDGKVPQALSSKRDKKDRALADKTGTQYLADKSHVHYVEDRRNEEIVDRVEEVDVEDITTDEGTSAGNEVDLEDIQRNGKKKSDPPRNPVKKIVDPDNVTDADIEEFLG
jgi:hypothetical protein